MSVVRVVSGRSLVAGELALLREVLVRRRPDLVPLVEDIGVMPLSRTDHDLICAAVVDEMCELEPGAGSDRRDLELEELLLRLGEV
jgi:hypothetical protein